jgi:glycosyltransferase involved in cell wall biosynthesis
LDHLPDISVIVPVRNEGGRIQEAIHSIARGRSHRFHLEIVVVDDASEDGCCSLLGSAAWTRDSTLAIRVVRLPKWSGIPYARNVGAGAARGRILFITDANVVFPKHWDVPVRREIRVDNALCAAIGDTASSFVGYGCALELPSMGVRWLKHPASFNGYVPVAPCGGTIISASLFRKLGGYDGELPLYGAAEPEFSVRLWLSGAEIRVLPDLILRHHFRARRSHRSFLARIEQILIRNYVRFGLLYLDGADAARMLRLYSAKCTPRQFRGILSELAQCGVWQRRAWLKGNLEHDFNEYLRRFPIIARPTAGAH